MHDWSHALFHSSVALLNHVVEIAVRPRKEVCWQEALFLEFAYRYMRGGIAIQRDLLENALLLDCLLASAEEYAKGKEAAS